ncbi:type II secretion system minor pseudopilin GspJ [Parasphingorhabdus sp.]|uniref:type II secretion system minor pseudopilin GspJ n=1 Tax=Parasphingorhabdus sp. TaxID=2709688 RepID=UPI003D2AF4E2
MALEHQQADLHRAGFTLVEMMVALFVFSLLSVAGVVMLRSAVDSDETTAQNLSEMAEVQRFVSLIEADLSQAVARTYRDDTGQVRAAFSSETGSGDAAFLKFIRGGQSNLNGESRSNLERVEYRITDGRMERLRYQATDGGEISEPAILLTDVSDLQIRYRTKRGQWAGRWEVERLSDLPRAVELVFQLGGRSHRHLFLVGTGYL